MTAGSADTLNLVRAQVKDVLEATPAFRALDAEQRRDLAHDMVKVARYMVDAGGDTAGVPMRATVATPYESSPAAALAAPQKDLGSVHDARTAGQKFADSG